MNNRGSILITIIFMILISFIGLSMLDLSIIHGKIIKARNIQRSTSEKLFNRLIIHLHNDTEKIIKKEFDTMLNTGYEFFNGINFPDIENKEYKVIKRFKFSYREYPLYRSIKGLFFIKSCLPYNTHSWNSSSIFHILSGNIPFNYIPLYVNMSNKDGRESFFKDKKIFSERNYNLKKGTDNTEFDIKSHLSFILNIGSNELNIKSIKELLELPGADSFLPDGVYIIESEAEIGPIIVQGDIEKILLSAEKDFQQIEIIKKNKIYKIKYPPGIPGFETENFNCDNSGSFNEKIIVNGNVLSLESSGPVSLHGSARIELIVLGNLTVGSSLETFEQSSKTIRSQPLTIIVSNSPFIDMQNTPEVKIKFSEGGTVTASINIEGKFVNLSNKLILRGNLYCENIENIGTIIIEKLSENIPLSNNNFFIKNITILKDYRIDSIEENIGNGQ